MTTLQHDSLLADVEIEWGEQMQGELGLDQDPDLAAIVFSMARYIIGQRETTNVAQYHDGNMFPDTLPSLAKQIVWSVQVLTSPEYNGA